MNHVTVSCCSSAVD